MARQIKYYNIRHGRGFWEPTAKMRRLGFDYTACGEDGPSAWKIAHDLNAKWDAVRKGERLAPLLDTPKNKLTKEEIEDTQIYPRGSLGEAFKVYRQCSAWKKKPASTKDDWFRGWRYIKEPFGDYRPRDVTLKHFCDWRDHVERVAGVREAHRAHKIWRAMWTVNAANKYCEKNADPSAAVPNEAAKGREESWIEPEVRKLVKTAWREKFYGLAAAMAVAWDTQMSPVDVRSLKVRQFSPRPGGGAYFRELSDLSEIGTSRKKTGKPVGGLLRWPTLKIMTAYARVTEGRYAEREGCIFRNRSGGEYTKDKLADDFASVRAKAFGSEEKRTLADFRRSGAIEAIAGGVKPAELSHTMANSLSASNALFAIYCPANVVSLEATAAARKVGRKRIAEATGHGTQNEQKFEKNGGESLKDTSDGQLSY